LTVDDDFNVMRCYEDKPANGSCRLTNSRGIDTSRSGRDGPPSLFGGRCGGPHHTFSGRRRNRLSKENFRFEFYVLRLPTPILYALGEHFPRHEGDSACGRANDRESRLHKTDQNRPVSIQQMRPKKGDQTIAE
jgi:hypothetical protein